MHLFIVRHGECLGQCDEAYRSDPDSLLSALGGWQVQRLAQRLAREEITHLLSSPLVRALATASAIAETTGLPLQVRTELREGFTPTHQARGRAALQEHFPLAQLPESIQAEGWSHGGDTYDSFIERAQAFSQQLVKEFAPSDRVVLVTHGGFANYLLHALLGIDPAAPRWFKMANCAISHVHLVPEPFAERPQWPLYPPVPVELLSMNDVAHLAEPG